MKALRVTSICLLGAALGCSSKDDGFKWTMTPGARLFGDSCEKSEDCASTVCVTLGNGKGVCSTTCDSSSQCPVVDNWDCIGNTTGEMKVCACLQLSDLEVCGDGLDNDCNGKADDCRICQGVPVPDNDPNHCGSCDKACRADQQCANAVCSCPSESPNDCGFCTNTQLDPKNCGACGTVCELGQTCTNGKCECPAGDKSTLCKGVGCIDKNSNQEHCGECGKACALGEVCKEGTCGCPTEGHESCEGVGCVDKKTDPKNCGACGNACGEYKVCVDGACVCTEGGTLCGDTCVDTKTSSAYCGSCDKACGSAQACVDGTCGCTEFGLTVCGDACSDLNTDPKHCGSCDKACAPGEFCTKGKCVCPSNLFCDGVCIEKDDSANCGACGHACPNGQVCGEGVCKCVGTGLQACGDTCVDLKTDEANCGTCGNTCPVGQICSAGQCRCTYTEQTYCAEKETCLYLSYDSQNCGACGNVCRNGELCQYGKCQCSTYSQTYCTEASSCVSLTTDSKHCGTCGNACRVGESCSSGRCQCSTYGQTYCEAAGGCVSLTTDSKHCGTCGHACRNGEVCSSGTCTCPSGQTYCAQAGTCVSLTSNVNNCGTCGKTCQPTQVCQYGACTCPTYGQQFCASANACIGTLYDEENCGACGKTCPVGTSCLSGVCSCDSAGTTLCSGVCSDLQTDEANCGACGNACSGNYTCTLGKCVCPAPIVATPVRITNNTKDDWGPSAAWDGTHVGVAYAQVIGAQYGTPYHQLRFALLNSDGSVVSDVALTDYAEPLNFPAARKAPQVIWNGEEYAVTWLEATGSSTSTLAFLRVDASGSAKGEAVPVLAPEDVSTNCYNDPSYHLAWSTTYGGYAVVMGCQGALAFRRIGTDASSMDAPNVVTQVTYSKQVRLVASPSGSWGAATANSSSVRFTLFNADGSRTQPPTELSSDVGYFATNWLSLVWGDGTWLTAWIDNTESGIVINRGSALSAQQTIVTGASTARFSDVNLAMAGDTLAVGWTEAESAAANASRYRLQRFSLSATTPAASAKPVHEPVDMLSSATIGSGGNVTLVATGSDGVLAIWADNRWGSTREIYAAAANLQSCP